MNYERVTIQSSVGIDIDFIKRSNEDGSESWIPLDPTNSDYQAYLKSLDEAATL